MGPLSRAMLTLYSLVTALISLLFMLVYGLGWTRPLDFLYDAALDSNQKTAILALSAIYFLFSLMFFSISLRKTNTSPQSVVHETALGQVSISLDAIENLVRKVTAQIRGVREVKPRVRQLPEGGVAIGIKVMVAPDVSIPEMADRIQSQVKDYVSEISGVKVADVKVFVENITSDLRSRVE